MLRITFIFCYIFLTISQPVLRLDNDPDFIRDFKVQILKRGQPSELYPRDQDELLVHYHGETLEGRVFDSSADRRNPFKYKFGSRGVIQCWNECFQRMNLGDKIRVQCPAEFAYGSHGVGSVIPPNSDLIMEFELLGIGDNKLPQDYIDDL